MSRYLISTGSLFVLAMACGGTSSNSEMAMAEPASGTVRTVVADRDVRMLLVDLAAGSACEHLSGEFLSLTGSEQQNLSQAETKKEATKPKRGRLWIEHCAAKRTDGDQVKFELRGRGWRWVDKQSEQLGAKFEVSQYVRFNAQIDATATVDLSYARSKRVLTFMLTATEPVRAKVNPIGEVDAEAKGPWASLLGAAATVFASSPDEKASKKFSKEGSQKLATKLSTGYTVAIDLCTSQKYETIGELAEGALPNAAVEPRGRRWKENERVELMEGGLDLSGPYKREQLPFGFELRSESGDGVVTQVICTADAHLIANAFLSGKEIPDVPALAGELVSSGKSRTLRVEEASCDLVLYTRPAGRPATYRYLAYPERDLQRGLVPCEDR